LFDLGHRHYYYHSSLKIVTEDDMRDPDQRRDTVERITTLGDEVGLREIFVGKNSIAWIDDGRETLGLAIDSIGEHSQTDHHEHSGAIDRRMAVTILGISTLLPLSR
jgi:hypothetical protein